MVKIVCLYYVTSTTIKIFIYMCIWGWEDPLEWGTETHSSIHAWRVPMDREAWRATVLRVAKSQTQLSDQAHTCILTGLQVSTS